MTPRDPRLLVVQPHHGGALPWLRRPPVAANLGCALTYFGRGDVIAGLAIGLVDAVLLLGASSGDSDAHRAVGVTASVSTATLFLMTFSIPVLFAPLAIAGLVVIGQFFLSADQIRCP